MYPVVVDRGLTFTDGWTLREDQLVNAGPSRAALFTTSNGVVGVRRHEREPLGRHGLVLVAGCYETRPYAHPEHSFSVPEHYQTLVGVTDPLLVRVVVDGISVEPSSGTWLEHVRELDLRTGCVSTKGRWQGPDGGAVIVVRSRRMVSLAEPGLLWWQLDVVPDGPEAGTVDVELVVEMVAPLSDRTFPGEPEALSRAWGRYLRPVDSQAEGSAAGLVHATDLSGRAIACASDFSAVDISVECGDEGERGDGLAEVTADRVVRRVRGKATSISRPGSSGGVSVTQRVVLLDGDAGSAGALLESAMSKASGAHDSSFDEAIAVQRRLLDRFWAAADVEIGGQTLVEASVRYSIFQAFQAVACNDGRAAAAKGLTGQGYEGHHFWEQEVFVGHAMTYLMPEVARAPLAFRCRTLDRARERAARLAHRGAAYPWRTIDGTEASAFFPAGAAQYHVNADIAWAVDHYLGCTGDESFLSEGGFEILVETARLWQSIGRFDEHGRYRIEGITGPDEYTALVDDNLYTNLMAARNMRSAAERLEALAEADPSSFRELVQAVDLGAHEAEEWRRAADAVAVPFDEALGVHGQDAGFLTRPKWDLDATPPECFPLQDHFHMLELYRHQVLKQADAVLAHFLLPEHFTAEQRRRDFDYYEPITTHDSSLSAPVHAVLAAWVGHLDLAWDYLDETATADLRDRHDTLDDGLHLAATAGSWLAVACGFGGLTVRGGVPTLRPLLPRGTDRLRFGFRLRGSLVEVVVDPDGTTYSLLEGDGVELRHDAELVAVEAGQPARVPPLAVPSQ